MKVSFSAQFGGRDAAGVVLPHFRALKTAATDVEIAGFPRPELAFILRVDGQVNAYGFSGLNYIEFDRDGEYIAIDIGIDLLARNALSSGAADNPLISALQQTAGFLKSLDDKRLAEVDYTALDKGLREIAARYENIVHSNAKSTGAE